MGKLFKIMTMLPALALASCAHVGARRPPVLLDGKKWRAEDGKVMPYHVCEAPQGEKPRAVMITVHGLSGAASDFWMLEESLPPAGMTVYGMELRGMGNDPDVRNRGDIRSAEIWQRDFAAFNQLVRARHPGVPLFWYAESLGSLIVLHSHTSRCIGKDYLDARPAGIVLSSPSAGLRYRPGWFKRMLLHAALRVIPRKRVRLENLAGLRDKDIQVTASTTHASQMAVTPHHVPEFTLRLLREVNGMIRDVGDAADRLTVPVLVLASPNDVVASLQQVQVFFEKIRSQDKTLLCYDKSYHLLLHDVQRDQVLRDVMKWLAERTNAKGIAGDGHGR